MGKVTPIIRSIEYLKMKYPEHYTMDITAHWRSWGNVNKRLFGCIDLLLVNASETIGILSILKEHMDHYKNMIAKNKELKVWMDGDRKFIIHAWWKESNIWHVDENEMDKKEIGIL